MIELSRNLCGIEFNMDKLLNCGAQFPKGGVNVRSQKFLLRKFKNYICTYFQGSIHLVKKCIIQGKYEHLNIYIYLGSLYFCFMIEMNFQEI